MADDSSTAIRFLPVGLDMRQRHCLIVGGGAVGTRKALVLAKTEATITVVAPEVTKQLAELIASGRVAWTRDTFRQEHLIGAQLVVAATDDASVNADIVRLAGEAGVLACDASSAERSQVIFGALLQQEDVTLAVFTGGRDPALARRTRDRVAGLLDDERVSDGESA